MRRFSTVAAAAILLFTATGFAGYDNCTTTEQSSMLPLMGLACVSCGVQMYYSTQGKGDSVNPSERWLATLAVGARNIRKLNPGEIGLHSESIVKKGTAMMSMHQVVISQIQAYGFCSNKYNVGWKDIRKFITNNAEASSDGKKFVSKALGFDGVDDFRELLNDAPKLDKDGNPIKESLDERRRKFRETASDLIAKDDLDADLKSCLLEMRAKKVEQMSDQQSYKLCTTMADACDLEHDFCLAKGMSLSVQTGGGGGSGSSSQGSGGSQQNPRPPIPASSKQPSGGKKLAPPPVQ